MLSEDLRVLSLELGELSRRGFEMTPHALEIIGDVVADMAAEATQLEGRAKRPPLLLIINNRDTP